MASGSGPTGSWTGKIKLTHKELEDMWIGNGGGIGAADTAAAIAQAESGGCQYALAGPKDIRPQKACTWTKTSHENSCGYWQINLYAHPQYHAPHIFQQNANTLAAISISNDGGDFSPWTTYKTGAYKQYLTNTGGGGGGGGGSSTTIGKKAQALRGYTDVRHSLAFNLPTALVKSNRSVRRAYRALGRRSTLKG